jgi:hypothetical protein
MRVVGYPGRDHRAPLCLESDELRVMSCEQSQIVHYFARSSQFGVRSRGPFRQPILAEPTRLNLRKHV